MLLNFAISCVFSEYTFHIHKENICQCGENTEVNLDMKFFFLDSFFRLEAGEAGTDCVTLV